MLSTNYSAGGRYDFPFVPTFINPYILGRQVKIDKDTTLKEDTWICPFDADFMAVFVGVSKVGFFFQDSWDLFINNVAICETVSFKRAQEGIYFTLSHPVKKNDVFKFVYRSVSQVDLNVWLNYQFLADPIPAPVPTLPCNATTTSGSQEGSYYHDLGDTAGEVIVTYDMYGVPDMLEVFIHGETTPIASTGGDVYDKGVLSFYYTPKRDVLGRLLPVLVAVNRGGATEGTGWQYTIACPVP